MVRDFERSGDRRYASALASFEDYLAQLQAMARGEGLRPGIVPASTYWLPARGTVVGRSSLRHTLTPELEDEGGHIGYDIRPSARRRWYGTLILELTLDAARRKGIGRVRLTCDADNEGSRRIIEYNRGRLSGRALSRRSGKEIVQYWIEC